MIALISLVIVLIISLLTTRVATLALIHTGVSKELAKFQARSAFTGVGFTTRESENIVNHPLRRKILYTLMLLGNAGVVTAISSLILTFINPENEGSNYIKGGILVAALTALLFIARSRLIDNWLSKLINKALKRYTRLDVHDYASLLHLSHNYKVTELRIEQNDWLTDKKLRDTKLRDEGILVLGITRASGKYIGNPNGSTNIRQDDVLILYGRDEDLESLDKREKGAAGDIEHDEKTVKQENIERGEKAADMHNAQ